MSSADVVVRPLHEGDLDAVLAIQAQGYDAATQEAAATFSAKLRVAAQSCFIACLDGRAMGYLIALPADANLPPPLHSTEASSLATADALYLHDLAVAPQARATGVTQRLLAAYWRCLHEGGFRFACLTAVNGSRPFWERHGFRVVAADAALRARLAGYGDGATFMRQAIG